MNKPKRHIAPFIRIAAFFGVCLSVTSVCAAEFDVGRATMVFPTEGWRVVQVDDKGRAYDGEVSGSIQSETKIFVYQSPESAAEAVIVVRGSSGGMSNGYMSYSPSCKNSDEVYAEGNSGYDTGFAQCLIVLPLYTAPSVLEKLAPQAERILKDQGVNVPKAVSTVWSQYANSNGTFLDVRAFFAPSFAGHDASVDAKLPSGVLAQNVAWGRLLTQAVRGSVNSFSGKLVFPSLEFKRQKLALLQD